MAGEAQPSFYRAAGYAANNFPRIGRIVGPRAGQRLA
jgi:hypothetical protein